MAGRRKGCGVLHTINANQQRALPPRFRLGAALSDVSRGTAGNSCGLEDGRFEAGRVDKMKKYLIAIERTDSGYSTYSPDLPGCVSTGSTREQAETNMRDAIEFHVEGL